MKAVLVCILLSCAANALLDNTNGCGMTFNMDQPCPNDHNYF